MKLKNVIKASISKADSFQAGNIQYFLEIWKRITSGKYIISTLSKYITSTLTSGKKLLHQGLVSHELTAYLSIFSQVKLNELWLYYQKHVNQIILNHTTL